MQLYFDLTLSELTEFQVAITSHLSSELMSHLGHLK